MNTWHVGACLHALPIPRLGSGLGPARACVSCSVLGRGGDAPDKGTRIASRCPVPPPQQQGSAWRSRGLRMHAQGAGRVHGAAAHDALHRGHWLRRFRRPARRASIPACAHAKGPPADLDIRCACPAVSCSARSSACKAAAHTAVSRRLCCNCPQQRRCNNSAPPHAETPCCCA